MLFQTAKMQFTGEPFPHLKAIVGQLDNGMLLFVSFTATADHCWEPNTVLTEGCESGEPYQLTKYSGFSKSFVRMLPWSELQSWFETGSHGLLKEEFREPALRAACEGIKENRHIFRDYRSIWFENIGCPNLGFSLK